MDSRFSQLPGEIRNSIYELVLRESEGIPVYVGKEAKTLYHDGKDAERLVPAISGLPFTSRAIREETMKLFFSLNPLTIYCAREGGLEKSILQSMRELAMWCQVVGIEQTKELRKVTFDLRYRGWMINVVLSLFHHHFAKLKALFHPSVQMEVVFRAPYWDIAGLDLPVVVVLGDKTASLGRLNLSASQMFDKLHQSGNGQGSDPWNELKDCERRVREAIELMPDLSNAPRTRK